MAPPVDTTSKYLVPKYGSVVGIKKNQHCNELFVVTIKGFQILKLTLCKRELSMLAWAANKGTATYQKHFSLCNEWCEISLCIPESFHSFIGYKSNQMMILLWSPSMSWLLNRQWNMQQAQGRTFLCLLHYLLLEQVVPGIELSMAPAVVGAPKLHITLADYPKYIL